MAEASPLSDRVVILTGAGGGIGAVMARGFQDAGATLAAFDRSDRALDNLTGRLESDRLLVRAVDVADDSACGDAVGHVLDRFGRVDALVNLAGITGEQPQEGAFPRFWERDPLDWHRVQAINHGGSFHMARHVAAPMITRGHGRILNISTSLATMVTAGMAAYGPSKAAIDASTAIWARELAGTGVTCNVLAPGGPVATPSVPASWPRENLLSPSVMVLPAVWIVSAEAAETTGRRFIAREWDPARSGREQAAEAPLAGWAAG